MANGSSLRDKRDANVVCGLVGKVRQQRKELGSANWTLAWKWADLYGLGSQEINILIAVKCHLCITQSLLFQCS